MFGVDTVNKIINPIQPFSKMTSDSADVGLKIIYVGLQASATVQVDSSGFILLKHGPAGAEIADTTIQIGATPGTIDVSNSAGNTFGLVVDHINKSVNWRAYLVDVLRADSSNASTGSLKTMSATTIQPFDAATPLGVLTQEVSLLKDTTKTLNLSVRVGIKNNVTGNDEKGAAEIFQITSTNTFGSGTSKIQIYELDAAAKSEVKVYEVAGGATTVQQILSFISNGVGSFATSGIGRYLLVRMIGSAACTGNVQVIGAVAKGN